MMRLALLLPVLAACSSTPAPADPPKESAGAARPGPVRFQAPAGWRSEEPSNNMRKAQYRVSDKQRQEKDAELAVTTSSVYVPLDDNVARWSAQMGGSDAKREAFEGKLRVKLVDLTGTYTGDLSGEPMPGARMLVAILESDDGPWYFKLVGPAGTVGDWREEFVAMLKAAGP